MKEKIDLEKGLITQQEILSLHEKITSCYIENPHPEESDEYYVKIRFHYEMDDCGVRTDGRQEFEHTNKEQIIADIIEFMESEKKSWKIV